MKLGQKKGLPDPKGQKEYYFQKYGPTPQLERLKFT